MDPRVGAGSSRVPAHYVLTCRPRRTLAGIDELEVSDRGVAKVPGENLRVTRAELAFRAIAPGDLDHAVGPRADPLYNSHEPAGANQAADYDDVVQLLGNEGPCASTPAETASHGSRPPCTRHRCISAVMCSSARLRRRARLPGRCRPVASSKCRPSTGRDSAGRARIVESHYYWSPKHRLVRRR
jgi:hypothetical protein